MGLWIHLMKKCVELQKNWPLKKIVAQTLHIQSKNEIEISQMQISINPNIN